MQICFKRPKYAKICNIICSLIRHPGSDSWRSEVSDHQLDKQKRCILHKFRSLIIRAYLYAWCVHSNALQRQKSCTNKKQKQNVTFVSRPNFHVLSNGALVSGASRRLCTGQWGKLFTEPVPTINLHFRYIGLNLQENQVHNSKEQKILV
jgi:hypothetical protein